MIVDTLNKLQNITTGIRATDNQIEQAEKELGLKFASEYIQYLKRFGVFSANGIEVTGITNIERLNVVSATRRERELNRNMPEDMYVIENLAIDGFAVLSYREKHTTYKELVPVPKEKIEEEQCEHCGKPYAKGQHLTCLHCGTVIKSKRK